MHYRRLGRSGLKVSEISLGTWITFGGQVEEPTALEIVRAAYEHGINGFDTADFYACGQAETLLGHAIAGLPRRDLVLSSKVFYPMSSNPNDRGLSRKHVVEAIHTSLRRLNTDYLDIYYCNRFDPDTPIDEVAQTMDMLVRQGKILYWGTSEWETSQIAQAYGLARQYGTIAPSVEQPQYNIFRRKRVEVTLSPLTREFGLGLATWGPLYSGLLSGKYNDGIPAGSRATLPEMGWLRDRITPARINIVRQLTSLAQDLEITTAQLAIAWLLRRKEVSTVICGVTRLEQLDENLGAAAIAEDLSEEMIDTIERIIGEIPE